MTFESPDFTLSVFCKFAGSAGEAERASFNRCDRGDVPIMEHVRRGVPGRDGADPEDERRRHFEGFFGSEVWEES